MKIKRSPKKVFNFQRHIVQILECSTFMWLKCRFWSVLPLLLTSPFFPLGTGPRSENRGWLFANIFKGTNVILSAYLQIYWHVFLYQGEPFWRSKAASGSRPGCLFTTRGFSAMTIHSSVIILIQQSILFSAFATRLSDECCRRAGVKKNFSSISLQSHIDFHKSHKLYKSLWNVSLGGKPPLPSPDWAKGDPLQRHQVHLITSSIMLLTRIMATHHTGFLELMDRIIVLEEGKCVLEGRWN